MVLEEKTQLRPFYQIVSSEMESKEEDQAYPNRVFRTPPKQSEIDNQHYTDRTTVAAYSGSFFYSGAYASWQHQVIIDYLDAQPEHKVVDIGGGSGRCAAELHKKMGLEKDVLCVDGSEVMLHDARALSGVQLLCNDAVDFSQDLSQRYDRCLMKEMIHHIQDPATLFRGIYSQLNPNGIAIIVTRPHKPDYPFFDAALQVWSDHQLDAKFYGSLLQETGFDVNIVTCDYPERVLLPKQEWLDIVSNRVWSCFAQGHFDDVELQKGVEEMKRRFQHDDMVAFTESIILIVGQKR